MKSCKDCGDVKAPGRSRCWPCYYAYRKDGPLRLNPAEMNILFIDIETRPATVYTWDLWKANIGVDQILDSGGMLCFAAKWYGGDTMFFSDWDTPHNEVVHAAHVLLSQADVVVHYYGSRFDIPHLNREFLQYGYAPPSPYRQVDLKLVAAKQFKFISNKLQYVSRALGLPGKVDHEGFMLWRKVMEGDSDAQKRMKEYNIQDAVLLQDLYEILLPWIPGVPNGHLYSGAGGCPNCGAADTPEEHGLYRTRLSVFQQYRCNECGSFFRANNRLSGVQLQGAML